MQVSDFVRMLRFRVVAFVQSQQNHALCLQTSRIKLASQWPWQKYWASINQTRRISKLHSLLLKFPQVCSNNPFSERDLSYLGWNPGSTPVCDSRRGVSWLKCTLQEQKWFLCCMPAAWLFYLTMAIFILWERVTVVCIHCLSSLFIWVWIWFFDFFLSLSFLSSFFQVLFPSCFEKFQSS